MHTKERPSSVHVHGCMYLYMNASTNAHRWTEVYSSCSHHA